MATSDAGATRFGSGSGAISGYDISKILYELDGHRVVSVSFALDPPGARTVRVRLSPVGGWHDCSLPVARRSVPFRRSTHETSRASM